MSCYNHESASGLDASSPRLWRSLMPGSLSRSDLHRVYLSVSVHLAIKNWRFLWSVNISMGSLRKIISNTQYWTALTMAMKFLAIYFIITFNWRELFWKVTYRLEYPIFILLRYDSTHSPIRTIYFKNCQMIWVKQCKYWCCCEVLL